VAFLSQSNPAPARNAESQIGVAPASVTTLGNGLLVTGNIVCAGAVNVLGRVTGDIRARSVTIAEGGRVDGTITVEEAVIRGAFKGTLVGNCVKIQGAGVVDGEVHNKTLSIEENALFEGVSRRLDNPVKAPSLDEIAAMAKTALGTAGKTDTTPFVRSDVLQLVPEQIDAQTNGIDHEVLA
jgi:cytoskeletal protein CcmA (bactofilin family)